MTMKRSPHRGRPLALMSAGMIVLACMIIPAAMAAEQPKAGGTLTFAVAAEPASYDLHRETSFASIHPVAPHYRLLLKFDQWKYPELEGDGAERWNLPTR